MRNSKIISVLLMLLVTTNSIGSTVCSNFLEFNKFLFLDKHGVSPIGHFREEYDLLKGCLSHNDVCITAVDPSSNRLQIVSSQSANDSQLNFPPKLHALTAFTVFQHPKYGEACLMGSYGGGSAAAWAYDGKTSVGNYSLIENNMPISGEFFSPSDLTKELKRVAAKGKWGKSN